MPELPDITIYLEALEPRIVKRRLDSIRVASPFLLRTTEPPLGSLEKKTVRELRRVGKRIAMGFDGGPWLVLHLMIAGRLHWRAPGAKLAGKNALAAFDFGEGTLVLTEAGSQRRAALHVVEDPALLDPGGLDVHAATAEQFAAVLKSANHTLKRALTDPRLFSGIGNAYSDEILHAARMSPVALTFGLKPGEVATLRTATIETLDLWTEKLRAEYRGVFPEKVTAFREGMAVHGRFGEACPRCGGKVQRVRYAANETNYCPRCQTGGKLLADRSLSLLLKKDWPKTLEEMEDRKQGAGAAQDHL